MTVTVTRAACPSCGGIEVFTIHIRSDHHDQMVCQSCRGRPHSDAIGDDYRRPLQPSRREGTLQPPTEQAPSSARRQSSRRSSWRIR